MKIKELTALRYVAQLPGQLHVLVGVTPRTFVTIWIPFHIKEKVIRIFLDVNSNNDSFIMWWHVYLQKLWLPSPCSRASDLQALLTLRLTAGESHGRQREPLFVTDTVPLYD